MAPPGEWGAGGGFWSYLLAEGVGFEPTRARRGALAVFKTAPFSRSGTPP